MFPIKLCSYFRSGVLLRDISLLGDLFLLVSHRVYGKDIVLDFYAPALICALSLSLFRFCVIYYDVLEYLAFSWESECSGYLAPFPGAISQPTKKHTHTHIQCHAGGKKDHARRRVFCYWCATIKFSHLANAQFCIRIWT